ncbi:MAG: 4-hydroxythreonine-4-phosphate dehydrogenase PdxA [Candidatus Omnitrophica bacterium]|nr:4-hydroxythreonine-4-phosphate dehydrogenase PdxA [Candidatus Omnitrophota bacterium]
MGDPAGIGPEVLLKALSSVRPEPFGGLRAGLAEGRISATVLGDLTWLKRHGARLGIRVPWSKARWVDCGAVPADLRQGRVQAAAGRSAHACLAEAVRRIRAGEADALVTAPVSKEAIVRAGIPWVGHTEFLARAFRSRVTMMFVTGRFRASLVTTHLPLRRLPGAVRRAEVTGALRRTREALVRDFGIRRPRIGLAALNPHGGEGGLFGGEEKSVLRPAARAFGRSVEGPVPSDWLMWAAARGRYDAVVALYHDQALIPVRMLGWESAVNVTLGLPFVRTSPVHGTAFDIAGTGRADPRSMIAAAGLAVRLARRRERFSRGHFSPGEVSGKKRS